ncbi:hypothetical protein ANN_01083 [Periplaneta americana]|uniref:MADF domain-containing protein n=1 Tax=Periplaneta americana TaxID=6978 RepID=A0ABQ8TSL3_PERAM|nr:hypothetical protein ANN_01083 [Periplaneta americana]
MDWPNDLCLDLIDLYKEHPVLWDQKHPSHYSKKRKIEAWDIIAMKLGVDMQSAQKKMMSLLGSFRAQKSKGRRSIETEQGRKDVYVSKWFGFDRMRFLLDKDDFRSTMDIECNRITNAIKIARIRDKFETHGTVCGVYKGRSGRPRTSTSPAFSAMVLERFEHSPQKSTKQCAREIGISRTSVRRIIKTAKLKVFIQRLLHALNEDDPDRRMQYLIGQVYLNMLRTSVLSAIRTLYGNEKFYFEQDVAPPHYHRYVRAYLDDNYPGHWIGRRGPIDFPPCSSDLTPLDFYLWGTLKNVVYRSKPATLAALRKEIETHVLQSLRTLSQTWSNSSSTYSERALRRQYPGTPSGHQSILRWHRQFKATDTVSKGKSSGRPSVSNETVARVTNRLDLNGCEALSLDESVTTIEKLDDSEGNDETSATADEAEHSDTPKDRIAAENAAYSSSYYKAKKIKKENSYQDPRIGDVFTLRDVHDHYIVSQTQVTSPPDRFTVYGLHVANKLRTYNTRTANIVEHAVNNILFQADMGNYDTDHADNHDSQSYLS